MLFLVLFSNTKRKKTFDSSRPQKQHKKTTNSKCPTSIGANFPGKIPKPQNLFVAFSGVCVCVCVCRCPLLFHQSFLLVTFHRGGAVKKTGWVKKNGGPVAPRYILAVVSAGPGRLICFFVVFRLVRSFI